MVAYISYRLNKYFFIELSEAEGTSSVLVHKTSWEDLSSTQPPQTHYHALRSWLVMWEDTEMSQQ